jgi:hypothetical protein
MTWYNSFIQVIYYNFTIEFYFVYNIGGYINAVIGTLFVLCLLAIPLSVNYKIKQVFTVNSNRNLRIYK